MAKKEITTLNVGADSILNKDTELIRFEGTNQDFFWRIYGDVINPKCELVVPPTHQAIYIKDGVLQDVLEGGKYPIFEKKRSGFLGIGKKMDSAVVDIIFMNRTIKFNAKWGTKTPVLLRDPITEIPVHVRGYGEFEVGVANPKQFYLQIVGADKNFTLETLRERLYTRMLSYFGDAMMKIMHDKIMSYMDIQYFMKDIGDSLVPYLNDLFVRECGLNVFSFTVSNMGIDDEEVDQIEKALAERRQELKMKQDKMEIVAELERLEDRANARKDYEEEAKWQRELILKQLEIADKEKYYEVLKILAEHSQNKFGNINIAENNPLPPKGGNYCPECGHAYEKGAKFCPGCGKKLPGHDDKCPECGHKVDSGAKFCPNCGHKM